MKTKQQKRNQLMLERLLKMNEDKEWSEVVTDVLSIGLEEVAQNDGFGTERQLDPRGDGRNHRSGSFLFNFVEGIDK